MITRIRNNIKKLVLIAALLITFISCRFYFNTTKDNFTAHASNRSVGHGKNLTYNACGGCHYDPATGKFTGRHLNDLPKIAGTLYSANITQSATNGMTGKYTDAELFYLLKTGIARNGKYMPYMMKPMIADEDANDIITYLHSNDEAVAPADTTVGLTHINFLGRIGIRMASSPAAYNKGVAKPGENDEGNYGRYLASIIGCYHCHSQKKTKIDYENPEASKGYMQGGMKFKEPSGGVIYSTNITPDKETGIGSYTLEDLNNVLTKGIDPSGGRVKPPMPVFIHLTDKQVKAIYTYLNMLPPVRHEIKKAS